MGCRMQLGHEKVAIFDRYFASWRLVNSATVRCCKQSAAGLWTVLVALNSGVC